MESGENYLCIRIDVLEEMSDHLPWICMVQVVFRFRLVVVLGNMWNSFRGHHAGGFDVGGWVSE